MTHEAKTAQAAIGVRVKSGWATAVLLVGPSTSPRVLDRRVIDLCDPAVPESRQPYHAMMKLPDVEGAKAEERLRKVVQRVTTRSLTELLGDYRHTGHTVRCVGVVVGSDIDPTSIKNAHIRAHALEGRLFRTAIEDAARSSGLRCLVVVERHAYSKAAMVFGRSEDALKRTVAELGRSLGGPWRADEKTAALAAWMTLS